jgi:hypothetical protein
LSKLNVENRTSAAVVALETERSVAETRQTWSSLDCNRWRDRYTTGGLMVERFVDLRRAFGGWLMRLPLAA